MCYVGISNRHNNALNRRLIDGCGNCPNGHLQAYSRNKYMSDLHNIFSTEAVDMDCRSMNGQTAHASAEELSDARSSDSLEMLIRYEIQLYCVANSSQAREIWYIS
ncbi:hypothetical protein BDQ94DRAFT_148878 [Aspergillus welwitschiae]|uniref:Uncharacterized protein n=1 Tax=Aspergillus welwitschiae TaxID=1341132 RepID=A0A3F3PTW1_9EURO|nr:hypothetical protein BDQ94DRAFT_148878 [Aspergillus welwitschiae]RDH30359.1 hypothetical protein BDQ94DRAFT_148878 [Aspergillus welwitschiae]